MSDLDIICPKCSRHATFTYATAVFVSRNTDKPWFECSKAFELETQCSEGQRHVYAVHYPSVCRSLQDVSDLPEGYCLTNWEGMTARKIYDRGVIKCVPCGLFRKHNLSWPDEAWFQIAYKDKTLWAYDRETALKLLEYIESDSRAKGVDYTSGSYKSYRTVDRFLYRVPTHFQSAKARPVIAQRLKRKLGLPA